MPRLRTALIALLGTALLATAYTAGLVQGASTSKTAVRESLAVANAPKGAKKRTLGLSRVTVPAGAQLALHHHPGTQIASIQQGTLTYTVQHGSVTVSTGDADTPKFVRTISAGQTANIKAGQWIVEQPSTIHRAANKGKKKIVILLATLFPQGSPPSIPNN